MKDKKMIAKKQLFLLDMDGTIYIDNTLFDGTLDFFAKIKEEGKRAIFLTNNSSKSVDAYINKLARMGIPSTKDDFVTSIDATIVYLKANCKGKKIYASGTCSFIEQLKESKLNICEKIEDGIGCLVMGYDTELTYQKLENICKLLSNDIDYIATNPDLVCPTSYGYAPDCGSVAEMIYNATKKRPIFIGKPSSDMINLALEKTNTEQKDAVLIGDRIYTDIKSGVNAGIDTAFVLSGEGVVDDIYKYGVTPSFIFENIREIESLI